jgi:hypothetical protein
MKFRWNAWNVDHATRHGVSPAEAESVVRDARKPYPRKIGDNKRLVQGRGQGGRFVQVVYILDPDGARYVIHAMPLSRSGR